MNKSPINTLLKIFGVIAALYLFLVGINGMSSAIKNMGSDVANSIFTATSNPFTALLIGVFSTVLFQSSSTTTSLIVSMVSSGALTLGGAIPMVMGANIGTTVTNTIVSMGHISRGNEFKRAFAASTVHDFFNMLAVLILFPLEVTFHFIQDFAKWFSKVLSNNTDLSAEVLTAKSPVKIAVKYGAKILEKISDFILEWFGTLLGFEDLTIEKDIAYLVFSVLITFLMLYSLVKLLRSLVLEKIEAFFDQYIFKTALRAIGFGIILTIMVQSSSITTSLIVPLAGAGVLTLRKIFPFTLGANIGTTVTALLAALTGTFEALITAFSHLLFNIFGIIIIYGIPQLRAIPLLCAEKIALMAEQNKLVPLIYLLVVFVAFPLSIILLTS